ncbi:MAG TPA: flagellar hook-length control protein FliK [Steroidobacteraceae bacterium]|jgi:flagellar hook-length control protein FliK|nr:flagellar hook-length control protein FliK [Steroidobacteraceae bacterium]
MRVDLVNLLGSGNSPSPSLLAEWRVGAILEAVAVRDARSGQLWLDIGGQRHPARVASGEVAGPQDGERLQVRVLRNSPVLALETVSTRPTESSAEGAVIADALRKFVPRQQNPALLVANLAWIAQRKSGVETLPRSVVQAAAHLWHALPEAEALGDPKALEAAIAKSGVFLEANLAAHRGPPDPRVASDLKTLMLTLQRALQASGAKPSSTHSDAAGHAPVPTSRGPLTTLPAAPATLAVLEEPTQQLNELSRQADGAIARLTTVQISNSAPDPAVQSMLIDLPVRHEDRAAMLRLKIERDGSSRRDASGAESWTVEAAVDLGAIGALHAKVTLIGKRIGVQLRAESPAVVAALAQRADELETMLAESGLEVDRVVCLHGMPVGDAGVRPARLLDVRA